MRICNCQTNGSGHDHDQESSLVETTLLGLSGPVKQRHNEKGPHARSCGPRHIDGAALILDRLSGPVCRPGRNLERCLAGMLAEELRGYDGKAEVLEETGVVGAPQPGINGALGYMSACWMRRAGGKR